MTPTPLTVKRMLDYREQCRKASDESQRRRNARKRGYRGPLTRKDLAAR